MCVAQTRKRRHKQMKLDKRFKPKLLAAVSKLAPKEKKK